MISKSVEFKYTPFPQNCQKYIFIFRIIKSGFFCETML